MSVPLFFLNNNFFKVSDMLFKVYIELPKRMPWVSHWLIVVCDIKQFEGQKQVLTMKKIYECNSYFIANRQ